MSKIKRTETIAAKNIEKEVLKWLVESNTSLSLIKCHADQHRSPGTSWWYHNVLKPQARRRFRRWKAGKMADTETERD